jgi:tetratricopeptide (TPR) repeat protein
MGRLLIISTLAYGFLALISTQALAQTDEMLAEAKRLHAECAEIFNAGKYEKAIEPCRRALTIGEKALGSDDPFIAMLIANLAGLYRAMGDYAKAEPLYQRALAINEKALGSDHIEVADLLNIFGTLYQDKGDSAQAKLLHERAIKMYEKAIRGQYSNDAKTLNSLALLYHDKGDYAKAESLYERALASAEEAFGSEDRDVAGVMNNLASLYQDKGDYAKAEPLHLRALAIAEKVYGGEHLIVAGMLSHLALLNGAKGDYPRAIDLLTRAEEISENNISAILATGSEKQKHLYLNTQSNETNLIVGLHARFAPTNAKAARLALATILRRKGRALDTMTDQIASLRRRAAPDDVRLLDAFAAALSQQANLQLSNDTRLTPADRQRRVAELETQIENLQGYISLRNAEFRAHNKAVTLDMVRRAIPPDAALIEIFAYQPYNEKVKSFYDYFGKARYVAFVLKPRTDVPQFVDLGDAAQIDAELKLWRAALLNPKRTDARQLGRKADERIMRPIRKLLGDTTRLFISPDGGLNLIPFAALVDESNRYLAETYSLDYLTSGRDLLRLQVNSENRSGAVIFANPTYNLTGKPLAACRHLTPRRGLLLRREDADASNEKNEAQLNIEYHSIDFMQFCYPPLRGTAEEATLIKGALINARVLTDEQATEAALKELNSPRILHVATHGFFLPDQSLHAAGDTRGIGLALGGETATTLRVENPLLRSGLIMAGANQKSSGAGEDGVLTAAEVAGLNLWTWRRGERRRRLRAAPRARAGGQRNAGDELMEGVGHGYA